MLSNTALEDLKLCLDIIYLPLNLRGVCLERLWAVRTIPHSTQCVTQCSADENRHISCLRHRAQVLQIRVFLLGKTDADTVRARSFSHQGRYLLAERDGDSAKRGILPSAINSRNQTADDNPVGLQDQDCDTSTGEDYLNDAVESEIRVYGGVLATVLPIGALVLQL